MTLETLLQLEELNVFLDITFNPPEPFTDLQANMTNKIEALYNETFSNTNEFYSALASIFNKQKDPHSVFYKPCATAFAFVFPFTFEAWKNSTDDYVRVKLANQSNTYITVTEQYMSKYSNETSESFPYLGYEVVKMTCNETALDDSDSHAAETIAYWAEDNVYYSKLQTTRFNRALYADFCVRSQRLFNIPETSTMTLRLQSLTDETDTVDLTIPWYGWARGTYSSLADACPVANSTSRGMRANKAEGKNAVERMVAQLRENEPVSVKTVQSNDELVKIDGFTEIQLYEWTTQNAGYLRIPSFTYSLSMSTFVDDVINALDYCNDHNYSRLIVDVRGNGGGYVTLGMRTLQHLHKSLYPVMGKYGLILLDFLVICCI